MTYSITANAVGNVLSRPKAEGGVLGDLFEINNSGELTLITAEVLDFEAEAFKDLWSLELLIIMTIMVRASDNSSPSSNH